MPRLHRPFAVVRRSAVGTVAAALVVALAVGTAWAQVPAGGAAVTRIVLIPFDASRSHEALGLATPAAVGRALNLVDGVFVPPVGDALLVLQRASQAGVDPVAEIQRLFMADAVVLGRVIGTGAVEVELVVSVGGEDRTETLTGSIDALGALWQQVAERSLALAGVRPSSADAAAVRDTLAAPPEIAVLGPLGAATARLPGIRLSDLETALSLVDDDAWLLSEAARVAALEGRAARALELAERASAVAPTHAEVRAIEGVVLAATGDRAGAEAAFRAALDANPAHAVALTGLAETIEDASQRSTLLERAVTAGPRLVDAQLGLAGVQTTPQRRLQALRRAAERLPDSITVQRALVDEVLAAGDARGALALLREAAGQSVGASAGLYTLASVLPNSVAADALAFVREGRERFPTSTSLAVSEADLLVATGDLVGAEASLREVLAAEPGSALAAEALSTVLARLGRVDEAREVLLGLEDPPDDIDVRIIELQLAAGRARSALSELEPRMAAGERDPMLRTLYGIALGRVGRIDEARAALQEVLDEAPDAELARRALTVLDEQQRVAGDADVRLEGDAVVAFEQGLYALEIGDYASAAAAFGEARTHTDAGLVAFYHAFSLHQQGDVRAAIDAYGAARAELGDNDVLLNNLGFAQLQVGRVDLALEILRSAVAANEGNAQAQLNLGLTHYRLGNFAEALTRFDRALALAPELEPSIRSFVDDARRRATP